MNSHSSNKVKILLLDHEHAESKEIQAHLEAIRKQLPTGVQIEIEQRFENVNPAVTTATIKEGDYDFALIGENVTTSIWKLIQESADFSEKPIFYLAGKIESVLDREIKQSGFSGTVAIAKDYQPLLRKGYRESNREGKDQNSPETQFNIASIMKTITALGVVRLVEERKLDKDKNIYNFPIRELLPKSFPKPEVFRDFTLHELLTHTSGLTDQTIFESYSGFEPFYGGSEVSFSNVEDFVYNAAPLYQKQELEGRGKHQYCNYGFFLLGLAIQAISGQDYYQFITDNVLKPAGMSHTTPRRLPDTAVPFMAESTLSLAEQPTWLESMTHDESDPMLNLIAINALDLFKKVKNFISDNEENIKLIHALFSEYQTKLKSIQSEEDNISLRKDFTKKLDHAYSLFCESASKDSHFQFKHSELKSQIIKSDRILRQWLDTHKEWVQNNADKKDQADEVKKQKELIAKAEQLMKITGPNGVYNHLSWPLQVLGGIQINLSIGHPAGCWFSTVDDLLKFHQALWKEDGALHQYAVQLLKPKEAKEFGYGYGIIVSNRPGAELGHTGSAPGVRTSCFTYPKKGITLALLANDDRQQNLQFDIEHFFIHEKVKYLDLSITPDPRKTLLDDIAAMHKVKTSGIKLVR